MATTRWWALWFVFNLFFLSWLFDWVKLGKDWASREKLKRQEVVRSSLAAALLASRPAVARARRRRHLRAPADRLRRAVHHVCAARSVAVVSRIARGDGAGAPRAQRRDW